MANVGSWHFSDLARCPDLSPQSGTKPTLIRSLSLDFMSPLSGKPDIEADIAE
jgi:hypothetical protein